MLNTLNCLPEFQKIPAGALLRLILPGMKAKFSATAKVVLSLVLMGLFFSQCRKEDEPETVQDIDGNQYSTLQIGSQTWMVENLKTTRFRNGDTILTTQPSTLDISTEQGPAYQWPYEGDESHVHTYGRLYTWYTVSDSRNLCPEGWHVPTDADLTVLEMFAGGLDITGNLSDFLGGYRNMNGLFDSIGMAGYWWSATSSGADKAWFRRINDADRVSERDSMDKRSGFAVKCLKD